MIFENSSYRMEVTMNLDEFVTKLAELLADAEIYIPSSAAGRSPAGQGPTPWRKRTGNSLANSD